ncbi:MAG: GreA/GreB family elongation factor [Candidatus Doudnabacteria bacterium]
MEELKKEIVDKIIAIVEADIKISETSKKAAEDESKFHKGAMVSRYDTFKEEAQYLAGGQERTLVDLREKLARLKTLKVDHPKSIQHGSIYAIVELEEYGTNQIVRYFLLPTGGGQEFKFEDKVIRVVSLGSPISNALIGKKRDEVEINIRNNSKEYYVVSVQ